MYILADKCISFSLIKMLGIILFAFNFTLTCLETLGSHYFKSIKFLFGFFKNKEKETNYENFNNILMFQLNHIVYSDKENTYYG